MAIGPYHSKATGNGAIHPATYVGSSDPASPDSSVTADNKLWIDTTTGTTFATGWLLKIRSGGNAAWTTILDLVTTLALKANLASPTFTGTPAAPTATPGDNTTKLATTAFVTAATGAVVSGVSSVFGRTGAVVKAGGDYAVADVTGAAPLASPTFTGTPAAPTAAAATNTTQLATTAFATTADNLKANIASPTFTGTVTIPAAQITSANLRDSAALSVIGRTANSSGVPADIAAGSDGDVLRRSGTAIGFGGIASTALPTVPETKGGTNQTTYALGDTLYASAANTLSKLAGQITATRKFLRQTGTGSVSAAPAWDTIVENDIGASTNDAGNTSTAITIDWSLARAQKVTATGNFTLTHSNMVAGLTYTLEVLTGAGSFTATFASTNWAGGTAPTLTVTASKQDTFTFYKTIGGTITGGIFGQSFTP